ncbi:MAG: hypothetical protein Q7J84_03145 [Sulfuricaulis sp.]|nr:hypothetical protein [Sulfuricaulis sp.]
MNGLRAAARDLLEIDLCIIYRIARAKVRIVRVIHQSRQFP